jgi:3-oxoacyl-ACP reductase-like protein
MSIFASILSKLGFGSAKVAPPAAGAPAAPAAPTAPAAAMAAPAAISVVDVVGQLEALAAKSVEKLNWRVSIVDLMKLLGLDSGFAVRKQLASELGCPADKMGDSAQMNIWLHQTVLQKLAANGGNVPKDLLP